jgi:hypothetical protein
VDSIFNPSIEQTYVSSNKDTGKVLDLLLIEINIHVNLLHYHARRLDTVTEKPAPVSDGNSFLTEWINYSKSIANIKNNDTGCFKGNAN